jgi:hypothetical protein
VVTNLEAALRKHVEHLRGLAHDNGSADYQISAFEVADDLVELLILTARRAPPGAVDGAIAFAREAWRGNDGAEGDAIRLICDELELTRAAGPVAGTDAEIGAMVRAAYAAHNSQPSSLVDLDRIESVVVSGVFGPGKLELTVRHSSKLKPGVER